ncbi:hypothetical protein AVEN_51420-1 [Araneus ventricosus]|uniref:Uncharacterized protein n=1 Tax=Araneus ventricosus TaxID=182803 RepID=A0A4Y2QWD0_ARAVE|nr:hypothetical protein AVEN_14734-1 [Araneus ventricosus]GBN67648.1 hypothetical protein AVEN_51420-1 [Araneus ventricosus]
MYRKGSPREPSLLLGRSFDWRVLSNATLRSLRQYCGAYSQRDCVFGQDRGLKEDSNDVDELVEEHNQEPITEELMKLHYVSQQEIMEESLSEKEEVTATIF